MARPALDGGYGDLGPVWDWQRHRWVPAGNPQVVSPDGSAYVYTEADYNVGGAMPPDRLRIVSVSTGADRLLPTSGNNDYPIAWTKDGIYIVGLNFEASTSGLRVINPATGAEHLITASGSWIAISSGAAWGFEGFAYTNHNYPDLPQRFDRLDLATGKVTNWYLAPHPDNVHLAAVDLAGRPIVVVDEYHVFRLLGPSQVQPLFDSPVPLWDQTTPQVDPHGLWFTVAAAGAAADPFLFDKPSDVWLYSDSTGLRKVASTQRDIVSIEGPCR
ncbi:MAG TPA: hypothetical protein VJT78_14040 [Candidatus Dormibacteraeota bacterium]|nr:hypothetical protein [Candidatus Dormibacteraeota bacterium]